MAIGVIVKDRLCAESQAIFLPKEWLLEIKGTRRGHVWILKLREEKGPPGKSTRVWFQDLSLTHKERTVGVRRLEEELRLGCSDFLGSQGITYMPHSNTSFLSFLKIIFAFHCLRCLSYLSCSQTPNSPAMACQMLNAWHLSLCSACVKKASDRLIDPWCWLVWNSWTVWCIGPL